MGIIKEKEPHREEEGKLVEIHAFDKTDFVEVDEDGNFDMTQEKRLRIVEGKIDQLLGVFGGVFKTPINGT